MATLKEIVEGYLQEVADNEKMRKLYTDRLEWVTQGYKDGAISEQQYKYSSEIATTVIAKCDAYDEAIWMRFEFEIERVKHGWKVD